MDFQTYVNKHRGGKLKSDILERWQNRVVAQGLDRMGASGAEIYLERYGKGIAAPKVIALAQVAEANGEHEMAEAFWAKAFYLEFGTRPSGVISQAAQNVTEKKPEKVYLPQFPAHLQPGALVTMQPVDAEESREFYINSERFIGQPKRDGQRLVIFKMGEHVYYQARSLALKPKPSTAIEMALTSIGGSFILDGEIWYKSVSGGEHRTSAQAATQNAQDGEPTAPIPAIYTVFKALWHEQMDLTREVEYVRIGAALDIWNKISSPFIEMIPVYDGADQKRQLVEKQKNERREGEIWVDRHCQYIGGKNGSIYRTKYIFPYLVWVTGLTPTTAEGRLFGAIEVSADKDGKQPMGSVGTGFDYSDQVKIAEQFKSGPFQIIVEAQGLTETGKLWLPRL